MSLESLSYTEKVDICPHFPTKKTEAQRGPVPFIKSCGQLPQKTHQCDFDKSRHDTLTACRLLQWANE